MKADSAGCWATGVRYVVNAVPVELRGGKEVGARAIGCRGDSGSGGGCEIVERREAVIGWSGMVDGTWQAGAVNPDLAVDRVASRPTTRLGAGRSVARPTPTGAAATASVSVTPVSI